MKKLKFIGAILLTVTFLSSTFAQSEITDEDLEKFVNVYKIVQTENQKLQQEMVEMIQDEGINVDRFNELKKTNLLSDEKVDANSEEIAVYEKLVKKIETRQNQFQNRVSDLIQKEGLTFERYQKVFQELRTNKALEQKFTDLMQQ